MTASQVCRMMLANRISNTDEQMNRWMKPNRGGNQISGDQISEGDQIGEDGYLRCLPKFYILPSTFLENKTSIPSGP
jgi:hypothetical protein